MLTVKYSRDVSEISWSDFETAYGNASVVEKQLTELANSDTKIAMKASHKLWCVLCHQHAYISSAALPAFPFLIEAFQQSNEKLKIELMDIFSGFAVCLASTNVRQDWGNLLFKSMKAYIHLFKFAQTFENEQISSFADEIVSNLNLYEKQSSTPST